MHPSWDTCWYFDLSLSTLLIPRLAFPLPIASNQLQYLVSDFLLWHPTERIQAHRALITSPRRPVLLHAFDATFHPSAADEYGCSLHPILNSRVTFSPPQSQPLVKTYPILPTWLPSSEHWLISLKARQVLEVSIAKPGHFCRYWQFLSKSLPRRIPSLVPVVAQLPSSSWKFFLSLSLPAKAFSPRWRPLHGTIG
ncbi:hypothetical protein EDC96DRAFT_601031 [Choanephora cucurbitarum]|nr:hypothetical protein EDC96DRAFT_601031 [Choanephora cucurbitarum]